jgi:hypothetical protein
VRTLTDGFDEVVVKLDRAWTCPKASRERWHGLVRAAQWASTDEVQKAAPKAKVLNRERVRFEVAGGNMARQSAEHGSEQALFEGADLVGCRVSVSAMPC